VVIVDVWFADPALLPAGAERVAERAFSAAERARHERLRRARDKTLYLAAHLCIRAALAHATATHVREWQIEYDPDGRPLAVGPTPPAISISHTDGLVACAVGYADGLGVDVERADRRVNAPAIARRDFSEREREELATWPEAERTRRFLEYWALKEAYLKARGIGLRVPLRQIDVTLPRDGDAATVSAGIAGVDDARCVLRLLRAPRGYVAALAVASAALGDFEIRQHEAGAADFVFLGAL